MASRLDCLDVLPEGLWCRVLKNLTTVERVRSGLVCRRWQGLQLHPEFWGDLDFEGANRNFLDNETVLRLCRKAGAALRSLKLAECQRLVLYQPAPEPCIIRSLAAEGLSRTIESLSVDVWQSCQLARAEDAQELRAACPLLASAALPVHGPWPDATAAARELACPAGAGISLFLTDDSDARRPLPERLEAFSEALCGALAATAVRELEFTSFCCCRGAERLTDAAQLLQLAAPPPAAAAAERAMSRLAAALAAPDSGPAAFEGRWAPLAARVFRALTAESRLACFHAKGSGLDGAGAALLAEALGAGRTRLKSLHVTNCDLSAGGGCEANAAQPYSHYCHSVCDLSP